MSMIQTEIAIVGAGIVGVCVAAKLAEAGRAVTVVDRTGVCEETSAGNAAALAFSDILPLAHKGMLRKLPRWLADPLGPLAIPPAYLPHLLPWLWRFWRAGDARRFETSLAAQAAMMRLAESEWLALMDRCGARSMLREDGSLELYEDEAEFTASLSGWAARERFGIAFEHVARERIEELQPGLSKIFDRGTFVPGWKTVGDPRDLGKAVWEHGAGAGAKFLRAEVVDARSCERGAELSLADGRKLQCRILVVAAGAWSHLLARRFGDRIPLETERGYNTTLPGNAFPLRRQLIFSGHGFVVTPIDGGIRVGGAVELAGLKHPPNFSRARAMLAKAKSFLPDLETEGGREWMGFRPSLPDSLPVIGRSRDNTMVLYAFGHGHLGLTQAAAAGRLIGDLVSGKPPAIDLAPFRASRF